MVPSLNTISCRRIC